MIALISSEHTRKNNVKGIICTLLGYLFFGIANAIVKAVAKSYNISQILAFEFSIILFFICLYVLFWHPGNLQQTLIRTPNIRSHLFRAILVICSLWCIFYGFKCLPLAHATIIGFSQVLFMNISSIYFLKEKANTKQWIAIFVGFLGILIVIRPSSNFSGMIQIASLVMMLGAWMDSIVLLYPRKMRASDSLLTTIFYYSLFSALFAIGFCFIEGWIPIKDYDVFFLIGLGIFALAGQTCVTQAFRFCSPSILSPLIYTLFLWDTLFGYVFWEEIPSIWVLAGAPIVIVSGVYSIRLGSKENTAVAV